MAYTRITALWNGPTGLPGYTRMKFLGDLDAAGAATAAGKMRAFFEAVASAIPQTVTIVFDGTAQVYDANGVLTGDVPYTPPATVVGSWGGTYAAGVGAVVNWNTSGVFHGRRVRGRTFVIPLGSAAYDDAGTIASSTLAALNTGATALHTGTPELVIFGGNATTGTILSVVGSHSIPDRAAVLRSRRN